VLRFDEDLSPAEWAAQDERDAIEQAIQDEERHRFEDLEPPEAECERKLARDREDRARSSARRKGSKLNRFERGIR